MRTFVKVVALYVANLSLLTGCTSSNSTPAPANTLVQNSTSITTTSVSNSSTPVTSLLNYAAQSPGGNLQVGANTITMTPCPQGFSIQTANHQVATPIYISGGSGAPEAVMPMGGTCVSGSSSGTVLFKAISAHSGAWTVQSATFGLEEAINSVTIQGGGSISIPAGTYSPHATIYISDFGRIHIVGAGEDMVFISRNEDYGDTLVIGNNASSEEDVQVLGLSMVHDLGWSASESTVLNPLLRYPFSAHIRAWACSNCAFENLELRNMPYELAILGGSVSNINDVTFQGLWDYKTPALQITYASLLFDADGKGNWPVLFYLDNNYFAGNESAVRPVTINGAVYNLPEEIGPRNMIEVHAIESLEITGGIIGGAGQYGIYLNPNGSSSSVPFLEVSVQGVHFDSARIADIAIFNDNSTVNSANNIKIENNYFNGEASGFYAVYAANNAISGAAPSVRGLEMVGNIVGNYVSSPLYLQGGTNFNIAENQLSIWNCAAVPYFHDAAEAAAIAFGGSASNAAVTANMIGNGSYHQDFGIYVEDPKDVNANIVLQDNTLLLD